MEQKFYDAVAASPVIAAVKNMEGLEQCLATDTIQVVFLLFGDICSIGDIVARVKQAGKLAMVHADLVTGLSGSKEIAVDFLHSATQADGIISTRPNFIRRARELHLYTVLRVFVIDSMALSGVEKLESVQEEIRTIEKKKEPESVPAPSGPDERLDRLNRLSDRK